MFISVYILYIYADLNEPPLFSHQFRMQKKMGLFLSAYTYVKCYQSNKNATAKIHLFHLNLFMAKRDGKSP